MLNHKKFNKGASRLAMIIGAGLLVTTGSANSYGAEDTAPIFEEITVTATKREESILDVPLAVAVIGAEELDQKNAGGFADYLTSIPGVQFNPAGNVFGNSISIRGVSDGTSSFLTQQPIALYLDDTALTLSQGGINLDYSIFGVEQINVIKGPNSTLYGASSLGGTIKVITKKPSLTDTEVRAKALFSSIDGGGENYNVSASVTTPLVEDKLGVEFTGYYKSFGGYIDDPSRNLEDINSNETYGGRVALRLQATDNLTADLRVYYQNFEGDGLDTFAPTTVGDLQTRPLVVGQSQKDEFVLVNLVVDYDLGFADLVSATSYFDRETMTSQDITFSFFNLSAPLPLTSDTLAPAEVFSQEVRLVSTTDSRLQWIIGGYYSKEDYAENFGIDDAVFGPLFNGNLQYEYSTYAVFAELAYDITDQLNLSVGGRYTDYNAPTSFTLFGFFASPLDGSLSDDNDDDFSPRIALNYNYDNGSVYAQASKGFRLGQRNVPIITVPGVDVVPEFFTSDSLWNYEVGAKTRWFDNRLLLNIAAYYIDWTDIQLTRTASTGFTFIDNVGSARILGLEVESTAYITEDTIFTLNFGIIDGELTETVPTVATEGTRLPGSPKFTLSSSLQQNFQLADNDAYARIDYLYYGEYDDEFVDNNGPTLKNGDYHKLDLRAGVMINSIDVSLFVTNVLDERPIITRATFAGEEITTIQPRTFGLSLGFTY